MDVNAICDDYCKVDSVSKIGLLFVRSEGVIALRVLRSLLEMHIS